MFALRVIQLVGTQLARRSCDVPAYELELLTDGTIRNHEVVADLHGEAGEIVAVAVASIKTARENR